MKYNYKLEYFEKSADYVKSKIDFQACYFLYYPKK